MLTITKRLNIPINKYKHLTIDTIIQFFVVVIGGGYKEAYIRACVPSVCGSGAVRAEYLVSQPPLLDNNEYRPFWIEYDEGVVTVGKGGQEQSFMEWDAGAYHGRVPTELHVGISTWKEYKGHGISVSR